MIVLNWCVPQDSSFRYQATAESIKRQYQWLGVPFISDPRSECPGRDTMGELLNTIKVTMSTGHSCIVWYKVLKRIPIEIPSGKRLHNYGKSPCYQWENSLFQWPFSIANCWRNQRVISLDFKNTKIWRFPESYRATPKAIIHLIFWIFHDL